MAGIDLALSKVVPETSIDWYSPTVLWRMHRADGMRSHAVVGLRPDGVYVFIWFVNDRPLGSREFHDLTDALRWSDQMQAQNWAVGWRLAPDADRAH